MKKRWIMAIALLLCLCLLTACKTSEPQRFQVKTQPSSAQTTSVPTNNVLVGDTYMDPLAEEDNYDDTGWIEELPTPAPATPTPALVFRGEYAGATPVAIDPIDKPTPTAVPPLPAFTYKTYEATKLGLSFEAPVGWRSSTPDNSSFVLTNPSTNVNYQAELVIRAERVSSRYDEEDLRRVVSSMLEAIEATDVVIDIEPSRVDPRTLLEVPGFYADYTATLQGGIRIKGRVQAACVEKVLYTVHLTAPADYWDNYKTGVYNKLRSTIQITK